MKRLGEEYGKIEGDLKYDVTKWIVIALWNITPLSALIYSNYTKMPLYVFLSAIWLVSAVLMFFVYLFYKFYSGNSNPLTLNSIIPEEIEIPVVNSDSKKPKIECLEIYPAFIKIDENQIWTDSNTGKEAILLKFGNREIKSERLPRVTARINYYNERGTLIHTVYHGVWLGIKRFAWFNNYSTQALVLGTIESGEFILHGKELGRVSTEELMTRPSTLKIEIQLIDRTGWNSTYQVTLEFDERGFICNSDFD